MTTTRRIAAQAGTALRSTLVSLVLAGTALAGQYEEGTAAIERKDNAGALRHFLRASDDGDARAQYFLGIMYYFGSEVTPQSFSIASKWYRKAAEQGNTSAQTDLGIMYGGGKGVPQNYAEALKWLRLAADQGNAVAQSNLGVAYANGFGVPQNYIQAHMWFNVAVANTAEKVTLDEAARNRDALAARMTPEQIAEAQRLAADWKPK
jgi:TPR repeat protein